MQQKAVVTMETVVSTPKTKDERVHELIARVRPYIQSHGGDVAVLGIDENTLTLKVEGTCAHCPLVNLTYNRMVKTLIGEEVPEITKVVLV